MPQKKLLPGPDCLRVFAIIAVVAGHTGFFNETSGGIGNKLFFVIAGFFAWLSLDKGEKLLPAKDWGKYYLKKIIRIIPTYWIIILAVFFLMPGFFIASDFSTDRSLFLNMIFVRAYGHFWFLQQLVVMYILAPFIVLLMSFLRRAFLRIMKAQAAECFIIIILLLLAFLEKRFLTADVLRFSGEGSHQQFSIWMFLAGMAAACAFKLLSERLIIKGFITDIVVILILTGLLFSAITPSASGNAIILFFRDGVIRTVLSAVMLLMLSLSKDHLIGKASGLPVIKALADCSLGIYLIHFFLIGAFQVYGNARCFILVFITSAALAYVLNKLASAISHKCLK